MLLLSLILLYNEPDKKKRQTSKNERKKKDKKFKHTLRRTCPNRLPCCVKAGENDI